MAKLPPGMTQEEYDQHNLLLKLQKELGANVDFSNQSVRFGEGDLQQSYNPFTQSFQVQGPGSTAQNSYFNYDPTSGYSINGVNMGQFGYQQGFDTTQEWQRYDPRIALALGEEDYGYANDYVSSLEQQVNDAINSGIQSGDIASSYRTVTESGGFRPGDTEMAFGADPSESQLRDRFAGLNFNDSTINRYLQRTNPELYQSFQRFSGDLGDASYLQLAYENASGRLGDQYQDDYYQGLQDQFGQLQSQLTPEGTYATQSDVQAVLNNPNLSDEVKQTILGSLNPTSSGTYERGTPTVQQPPSRTSEYAEAILEPVTSTQQPPAPVAQPTQNITTPADAAQGQTPWSSDFENQFLDIAGQFKTSFDDYLGYLNNPASNASPQANFNLSNMYGDTGQRNSGLVPTTPTNLYGSGVQAGQPTGKAGQSNQQSLCR